MIVSISLMSTRVHMVKKQVKQLFSGDVKPDKVIYCCNKDEFLLDKGIKKFPKIKNKKVEFRYVEPCAALKKYRILQELDPDEICVMLDDDVKCPKWALKLLLKYHKKFPNSALGFRGYIFPKPTWESTQRIRGWKNKGLEFVDALNGGWFQLVKPKFFHKDFFDIDKFEHLGVRRSDEIFVAYGLAKNGTDRQVVTHPKRTGFFGRTVMLGKNTIHDSKGLQLKEFHEIISKWRKFY